MKNITLITFLLSTITYCQTSKITLINDATGGPIDAAHIYLQNKNKTGTISNRDGVFVLKQTKSYDSIQITHLNFFPLKLNFLEIKNDTIKMFPRTEGLEEVILSSESAESILLKTIELLGMNHAVEPVLYEVFVRSQKYEEDKSKLHLFGEYIINLHQSKNHNSKFNYLKTRVRPFSKFGEEYFADMRLITPSTIHGDNIFKYKDDIFKKRKLKKYKISFKENFSGSQDIIIEGFNKEDGSKAIIYISQKTFGVKKLINIKLTGLYEEINFKEIENKNYLDYRIVRHQSSNEPTVITQTEAVYNIIDVANYDRKKFKGYIYIVGEPVKRYNGDWSDVFWEDYNYLPIPEWTKDLME